MSDGSGGELSGNARGGGYGGSLGSSFGGFDSSKDQGRLGSHPDMPASRDVAQEARDALATFGLSTPPSISQTQFDGRFGTPFGTPISMDYEAPQTAFSMPGFPGSIAGRPGYSGVFSPTMTGFTTRDAFSTPSVTRSTPSTTQVAYTEKEVQDLERGMIESARKDMATLGYISPQTVGKQTQAMEARSAMQAARSAPSVGMSNGMPSYGTLADLMNDTAFPGWSAPFSTVPGLSVSDIANMAAFSGLTNGVPDYGTLSSMMDPTGWAGWSGPSFGGSAGMGAGGLGGLGGIGGHNSGENGIGADPARGDGTSSMNGFGGVNSGYGGVNSGYGGGGMGGPGNGGGMGGDGPGPW